MTCSNAAAGASQVRCSGLWRRSSRCTPNNNCVELSYADDTVAVRDSKNSISLPLRFGHRQWKDFVGRSVR